MIQSVLIWYILAGFGFIFLVGCLVALVLVLAGYELRFTIGMKRKEK